MAAASELPALNANALQWIGIGFVLLGVVGGGIKLKGLETPKLRKAWQYVLSFAIGAVMLTVGTVLKLPEEFEVLQRPRIAVDPPVHRGPCPFAVRFTAQIRTSQAGRVKYAWVGYREASDLRSITIGESKSDAVTTLLRFGQSTDNDAIYRGAVYLRIFAPTELVSEAGAYDIICNP